MVLRPRWEGPGWASAVAISSGAALDERPLGAEADEVRCVDAAATGLRVESHVARVPGHARIPCDCKPDRGASRVPRGHHYNRLFHQVERFRSAGRVNEVERWVEDLRVTTLPLHHSFFL
jgi:hypothetical protein